MKFKFITYLGRLYKVDWDICGLMLLIRIIGAVWVELFLYWGNSSCIGKIMSIAHSIHFAETYAILEGIFKFNDLNLQGSTGIKA